MRPDDERGRIAGRSGGEPPGPVYPPREDTALLLPFARAGPGRSVLDIGTGSGRLAVEAARSGSLAVATDRNPAALRAARRAARTEGLNVALVRTDLARGLGRFDRIVANPPYLPTAPEQRDPDPWVNLALDGGPDGCQVLRRIVATVPDHLAARGRAYLLTSSRQSSEALAEIGRAWDGRGGRRRVVASRSLEGERLDVWELSARER